MNFKYQIADFFTAYRFDEAAHDEDHPNRLTFHHDNPELDFNFNLDNVETEASVTAKVETVLCLNDAFASEDFEVNMKDWTLLLERWREVDKEETETPEWRKVA